MTTPQTTNISSPGSVPVRVKLGSGRIALITAVAVAAIALVAVGATLYTQDYNRILTLSLLSGGGALALLDAIFLVLSYKRKEMVPVPQPAPGGTGSAPAPAPSTPVLPPPPPPPPAPAPGGTTGSASVPSGPAPVGAGSRTEEDPAFLFPSVPNTLPVRGLARPVGGAPWKLNVLSWNVGTYQDYQVTQAVTAGLANREPFNDAYGAAYTTFGFGSGSAIPGPEIQAEKRARLKTELATLCSSLHLDLICLQEVKELTTTQIQEILPPGYDFVRAFSQSQKNNFDRSKYADREFLGQNLIAYRKERFTCTRRVDFDYPPIIATRPPDTIVQLMDLDGTKLCVNSAHLVGFNLQAPKEEMDTHKGDWQLWQDHEVMAATKADIMIFAGDFNTDEASSGRVPYLRDWGFMPEGCPADTCFDPNTRKPKKLDHIMVRGATIVASKVPEGHDVGHWNRVSDHVPLFAKIRKN